MSSFLLRFTSEWSTSPWSDGGVRCFPFCGLESAYSSSSPLLDSDEELASPGLLWLNYNLKWLHMKWYWWHTFIRTFGNCFVILSNNNAALFFILFFRYKLRVFTFWTAYCVVCFNISLFSPSFFPVSFLQFKFTGLQLPPAFLCPPLPASGFWIPPLQFGFFPLLPLVTTLTAPSDSSFPFQSFPQIFLSRVFLPVSVVLFSRVLPAFFFRQVLALARFVVPGTVLVGAVVSVVIPSSFPPPVFRFVNHLVLRRSYIQGVTVLITLRRWQAAQIYIF